MLQAHECLSPPPPFDWLGSLAVGRHLHKPGYWVGLLFAIGSTVFLTTGICSVVRSIGDPAAVPLGLRSLHAALWAWPNTLAANLLFFPAGILQVRLPLIWLHCDPSLS